MFSVKSIKLKFKVAVRKNMKKNPVIKTLRIGRSFLCIRASKFWNRFSMRNRGKKDNGNILMKRIIVNMTTG